MIDNSRSTDVAPLRPPPFIRLLECRAPARPMAKLSTDLSSALLRRKTALITDWNNIHCGARHLGRSFDEQRLLTLVKAHCRLTTATAVLSAEQPELSMRTEALGRLGYAVVGIPAARVGGRLKANADVVLGVLAAQAVLRSRVTQLIVASGDGDVASAMHVLRRLAPTVRFVALGLRGSISHLLTQSTDAVIELGPDVLPLTVVPRVA